MTKGHSGSNRGFGAMEPEQQKEAASKGGKASHGGREKVGATSGHKTGHKGGQFTSETAREAGKKGGRK